SPRLTDQEVEALLDIAAKASTRKSKPSLQCPASPMRSFALSPATAISARTTPLSATSSTIPRHLLTSPCTCFPCSTPSISSALLPTRTFPKLSAPRPLSSSAPAPISRNRGSFLWIHKSMRSGIGAFFGGPFWRQQEAVSKLFSLFPSLPPCSLLPRCSSPFERPAKTKSGPQIRGRALKP